MSVNSIHGMNGGPRGGARVAGRALSIGPVQGLLRSTQTSFGLTVLFKWD